MNRTQKESEAYKKYEKQYKQLKIWMQQLDKSQEDNSRVEKLKTSYRCKGIGAEEVFISE